MGNHRYRMPALNELASRSILSDRCYDTGKTTGDLPGESLLSYVNVGKRREDHVFIEWHTPPEGANWRAVVSPDGWNLGLYDKDKLRAVQRARRSAGDAESPLPE